MAIYKKSYLFASATIGLIALAAAVGSSAVGSTGQEPAREPSAAQRNKLNEEIHLIRKSLDDLLAELSIMKREATSRVANSKSQLNVGPNSADASSPLTSEQLERIRQTKVSRFVLKRVAELESESLKMRDEMISLLTGSGQSGKHSPALLARHQTRQEDFDFDEPLPTSHKPAATAATTTTTTAPQSQGPQADTAPSGSTTTTTMKPEEEAAKIGFDLEALKRLGEEIGKRLDQFGKDAAKNLNDLLEGVKLVFKEPSKTGELETEIEARQAQNPNSLRGVHEQVIRLVDNMVRNYLGNVRRTIQRVNSFVDRNRSFVTQMPSQPRESPSAASASGKPSTESSYQSLSKSVVDQLQDLSAKFSEFPFQWARVVGKQQSPLLDRIPPRGVELWRDFWDTVRKQIRRVNEEFRQLTRDMSRMITGTRLPPLGPNGAGHPALDPNRSLTNRTTSMGLLYNAAEAASVSGETEQLMKQFQDFYEKLSFTIGEEQKKMDALGLLKDGKLAAATPIGDGQYLIDESDDEQTRNELMRNVALRQQIQQEINVFGSIFDIMREFIMRLRDSASTIRDIMTPGAIVSNDPVTPGPSVKPQVDQVLQETVSSQRQINSQAKPVVVAQGRPSMRNNGR